MSWLPPEERDGYEAVIQDALRGATITDAAVRVDGAGGIYVDTLEIHLQDGRVVEVGLPRIESPNWGFCKDIVIVASIGDEQREMTVQDFAGGEPASGEAA